MLRSAASLTALAAAAALAVPAAASPTSDYNTVHADFTANARRGQVALTPCKAFLPELQNAQAIGNSNAEQGGDDGYNGFPAVVGNEIARVRSGGCVARLAVAPGSVRAKRRAVFHFTITRKIDGKVTGVSGVVIRFAGHARRTNSRGQASLSVYFPHSAIRTATATERGTLIARTRVRVLAPTRARR